MSTYERIEFAERARRVYAPGKACAAALKLAAASLSERFGVSWGRAKELLKGRALPTVREMDLIRELDGAWCPQERKAKPDLMTRMHDKIEDIFEFVSDLKARRKAKREARLSQKSIIERMYQENRA